MFLTLAVFALLVVGIRFAVIKIGEATGTPPAEAAATADSSADIGAPDAPVGTLPPIPAATGLPALIPTQAPAAMPDSDALAAYVAAMSTEEKLGQLVMFGFSGVTEPGSEFVELMNTYHIGNIVLYGANINRTATDGGFSQASMLTSKLEQLNTTGIPLLVSIDVEGGSVQRFKWEDAPVSAATLGKKNDTDVAYNQFNNIGLKLRSVGINMNLAPVLDVAKDPLQTFLTTRIISSDEQVAASIGKAAIEGLAAAQCLSTAKHFPGHGATNEDTHSTTPVVNKTLEELETYELVPFRAGVQAGVDAVLVTHILYPNIDSENIASMSSVIMTDLLRKKIGFDGVIMSDDFRMGGLTTRYSVGDAAVQFFVAGGDLILCGPRNDLQKEIMTALGQAVEKGTLTAERLDASVTRILKKKMNAAAFDPAAALQSV